MPQIISSGNDIQIQLSMWEKVWSFHGNFAVSRTDIVSVTADKPQTTWKEVRAPGTFLPGVIKAGTYFTNRGKEFWYITRSNSYPLTLELRNSSYKRLVIGFPTASMRSISHSLLQ